MRNLLVSTLLLLSISHSKEFTLKFTNHRIYSDTLQELGYYWDDCEVIPNTLPSFPYSFLIWDGQIFDPLHDDYVEPNVVFGSIVGGGGVVGYRLLAAYPRMPLLIGKSEWWIDSMTVEALINQALVWREATWVGQASVVTPIATLNEAKKAMLDSLRKTPETDSLSYDLTTKTFSNYFVSGEWCAEKIFGDVVSVIHHATSDANSLRMIRHGSKLILNGLSVVHELEGFWYRENGQLVLNMVVPVRGERAELTIPKGASLLVVRSAGSTVWQGRVPMK